MWMLTLSRSSSSTGMKEGGSMANNNTNRTGSRSPIVAAKGMRALSITIYGLLECCTTVSSET